MGLLDGLEKLINEHGSAAILKERIGLAEDKYSSLQRKSEELKTQIADLEMKNSGLELNLKQAQEKIRDLEERLEEKHGLRLPEEEEKMLVLLSQGDRPMAIHLSQKLDVSEQRVIFLLEELEQKRLVNAQHMIRTSSRTTLDTREWRVNTEGRRYLNAHALLV